MNWFERLTGFTEDGYTTTQGRLRVEGRELVSTVNGERYGIGELTMPTLGELRARVNPARGERSSLSVLVGDVRDLHADPRFAGALFQVASQFNLLEMTSQHVTPEAGVAGYAYDPTQGPACAMAAGAATIYRNYLVPVGDGVGQTAGRQLDALAGVGAALSQLTGLTVDELWQMRNGYALCTAAGLRAISELLDGADEDAEVGADAESERASAAAAALSRATATATATKKSLRDIIFAFYSVSAFSRGAEREREREREVRRRVACVRGNSLRPVCRDDEIKKATKKGRGAKRPCAPWPFSSNSPGVEAEERDSSSVDVTRSTFAPRGRDLSVAGNEGGE